MRRAGQTTLRVVPCSLTYANAFVEQFHRHHPEVPGWGIRFCLAVCDDAGNVHGVATIGRPVAANRWIGGDLIAEVSRVATDGHANACSALYGAAARTARAMGFSRIVTYVLEDEPGTSLKAAGWQRSDGLFGGYGWANHPRPGRDRDPGGPKGRWTLELAPFVQPVWPVAAPDPDQFSLWEA